MCLAVEDPVEKERVLSQLLCLVAGVVSQFEVVEPADSLREPLSVLNRDPRSSGSQTLADHQQRIAQYQLAEFVPHAIRVHFETAKNLYLYAWFVYQFYPVAEKHALATLEFELCERLSVWMPEKHGPKVKVPRGLSNLLAKATAEKLITNAGLRANDRFARQRARDRGSMERIREMQARGLTAMVFDDSAIHPLPEDYAHDSLKIFGTPCPAFATPLPTAAPLAGLAWACIFASSWRRPMVAVLSCAMLARGWQCKCFCRSDSISTSIR